MAESKNKEITLADRTHPYYDEKLSDWQLYQSSAEGGDSFINEDNLFSHRLEDSEDYDERLERAYYLNFCDTIPSMYNSYIFKEGVERPANDDLAQFRENVDGKGTNASDFMKEAGYWASVFGLIHIFVGMPSSKTKPKTKRDQLDNQQYPYARLIFPTDLVDWAIDEKGNYKWVIVRSTYYEDDDPKVEREEKEHYMLITKDSWEIQDDEGESATFSDGSKNSGDNPLGYIPIYTMYHKKSRKDKIGQSLLKDIVYINRTLMNWCSCIDEMIERQTFSQLTVPDDGTLAEREESGSTNVLRKISTSSVWTYPAEAKHPPSFISPDVKNITTIWKLTVDHIKEIFRLSGLQGGTSDIYSSRSGRQSQYSFIGVNSALAEKSSSYQEAENQVSMMVLDYLKKNRDDFASVQYPTKFDVQALSEEIDGLFKVMERNFSLVMNKELQKGIARKSLPHATQIKLKEIEDEIDAGDGVINPIKGGFGSKEDADEDAEKDGQGNPNSDLEKKAYESSEKLEKERKAKKKQEE